MLYELAITPDVFDADHIERDIEHRIELRDLLRHLAEVGMVADLDGQKWRPHVDACLAPKQERTSNASSDLMKVLELLARRHRLAPHPKRKAGPASTDQHWLELIRESHKRTPFNWVVSGERLGVVRLSKTETSVRVGDVRSSDKWLAKRSRIVQMCEMEYRDILPPLLRHALRIDLVDPHLSPNPGPNYSIVPILVELTRPGARSHIAIHTTIKNSTSDSIQMTLEQWKKRLLRLKQELDRRHILQVVLWRAGAGDDDMHDRYLLTDQCGIDAGRGFRCDAPGTSRTTLWKLLDYDDAQSLALRYQQPQLRPHEYLGERTVT